MMVTWALFSCQGDIWNLAKQNEHITDHLNGGSVFVLLLIGGEYRDRTGDLLHAMHGAPLGELSPHSFGNNKKGTTQCVMPF